MQKRRVRPTGIWLRAFAAAGSLVLVGACVAEPGGSPTDGTTPPASPIVLATTPTPTATDSVASPNPLPSLDPPTAQAIRTRQEFGLRSDLAWVLAVAADPSATTFDLAIPLLPDEVAVIHARTANQEIVVPVLTAYAAAHADEFGGLYVEQLDRGRVVSLWTDHLAEHEAAIRARLPSTARFGLRQVAHTEAELRAIQERVVADADWLRTIDALMMTMGVDIIGNVAELSISSANPDAERLIDEHFGLGPDVLRVTSDGTGIYLQPWGTIRGHVVDAAGRPLTEPNVILNWQNPGGGSCGAGDVGYGPGGAEGFELPCTPGRWTIRVIRLDEARTVLGEATVDVPAGGVAEVTIVAGGG